MNRIATIAASCPPLLQEPIDQESAERLAAALRAIADPSRLRLLSLIQAQPDHEACVCHLTEPLGLAQPTVSHHLKVLHESGLLERGAPAAAGCSTRSRPKCWQAFGTS